MCAIAGMINFPDVNIKALKKSLYHRGPDENGHSIYKNVTLIHTRLAIQDVLNGQQPFEYSDFTIVFNGEIYNHLNLRKLYLKGVGFTTNSDTETLLYLYIKYQNKMFDMIDGMFAFAILNKKSNKLILARDRAGKKPLYLYKNNSRLFFSSELNSIKVAIQDLKVNDDNIYGYLRNGFFFGDTTPYKKVIECTPGHLYEINCNSLEIKKSKFFDILEFYKKDKIQNIAQAKNQLNNILHRSIKDRLLSSDLEVGAFLSGGIDSSLIVAIASEYTSKLKTFTVKFDGSFDESHLSRMTANKYNTDHYELNIGLKLRDDVDKILLSYGEPFMDSSAIPSYYVSAEAKKHVSVVLNGDGADEIFGGYRRYVPISLGVTKFISYFSYITKILPKPHVKMSTYNYIYRLLSISGKRGVDFYNSATNDIFEDSYHFKMNETFSHMENFIKNIEDSNISELSKFLYMDFQLIMKNDLLKKMDIATMSHSLEGRSPFLSKYMLEFAPTLSDNLKVKGVTTKYILRELAKQYLPREIILQPKRGFEVPLKKWVENDLKENIFDVLGSNCYSDNFIDRRFINNLLDKNVNVSDEKRAKMLWTMYSLDVWNRGY
jgi:asparagine synthase (glutamine-hydrolysing)